MNFDVPESLIRKLSVGILIRRFYSYLRTWGYSINLDCAKLQDKQKTGFLKAVLCLNTLNITIFLQKLLLFFYNEHDGIDQEVVVKGFQGFISPDLQTILRHSYERT